MVGGLPPSTQVAPPSVEYPKPWVLEPSSKPSPSFQAATRRLPWTPTDTSLWAADGASPARRLTIRSITAAGPVAGFPAAPSGGRPGGGSGGSRRGAGRRRRPAVDAAAGGDAVRATFPRRRAR